MALQEYLPDREIRPSLDYPGGVLGLFTEGWSGETAGNLPAIGKTRCQMAQRFYISGEGSDGPLWFPLKCGRWDCSGCGRLKREGVAHALTEGVRSAFARGERVRFITLTAPSRGMSLEAVTLGWNRMLSSLRPTGEVREYAGVIELQKRGQPHLHVLVTGEFIHYKRLSRLARGTTSKVKGQFGKVAWIEEVKPANGGEVSLAGYFTKELEAVGFELASYITKSRAEQLREYGRDKGTRKQPVRLSHGWYPGGQTAAREAVKRRWYRDSPSGKLENMRLWEVNPATGQVRLIKGLGNPAESQGLSLVYPPVIELEAA